MDSSTTDVKTMQTYSITEMCKEFGVTARALRFYEQRKLLAPIRCGETRAFTYRDLARLKLILRGKRFGFTLSEIREMLDLYRAEGGNVRQLETVLPKLRSQLKRLQRDRIELDETISSLEQNCNQISGQISEMLD